MNGSFGMLFCIMCRNFLGNWGESEDLLGRDWVNCNLMVGLIFGKKYVILEVRGLIKKGVVRLRVE